MKQLCKTAHAVIEPSLLKKILSLLQKCMIHLSPVELCTLQNYFRKLLNRAEIDNNEYDKMRPVSTVDLKFSQNS